MRRGGSLGLLLILAAALAGLPAQRPEPALGGTHGAGTPLAAGAVDASCVQCHAGIEDMHPWEPLGCVECHGGNGSKTTAAEAHVLPKHGWPADERVLERSFEPGAVRFRNPGDLRIVGQTCGQCHATEVSHLELSLHGTTAGHLSDALYENGLLAERRSKYGIFDRVSAAGGGALPHTLPRLEAIERLRVPREPKTLGDHFADLPRKACMQCHLWSEGVAVSGRLGQDGLYRGSGCSACHVSYAEDGRSRSDAAGTDRLAPGHPIRHTMTAAPPTESCVRCHIGDASVGNGFRGLAQLYPQMPAGPDVPNTTASLSAGQFFIKDPLLTPPDLHHAAGMACIDCHTGRDVMGDGQLYGAMEHAVEVECSSCHGGFERVSELKTERGRPLPQLTRRGDLFILESKVDGRSRRVKQAKDVINPDSLDYNPRAAAAMTPEHAALECYACHAGWNTNFFGFHFDRNLGFTQLDTITGQRTPGRVSTQERVFATLRQFTLGLNPEGRIAPYLVGFSSMGTVRAADGTLLLDQALPETSAGLSGMTMIHHQVHTTQPVARSCVECHRNPAAWGLGTGDGATSSFALARSYLFVVGERGLDTLLLDRENPDQSLYLARLPLGGAIKVALDADAVDGAASTAFVTIENAGVALVDVRNPALPAVRAFVAAGDARDAVLAGDLLLIANGIGGVRIADVSDRDRPQLVADLITRQASGLAVQWPRVLVADGPGGLLVVDVSVPSRPRITGQVRLSPDGADVEGDCRAVAALFQPARPQGQGPRTAARMLAVVANGEYGLAVVDVTEPEAARRISSFDRYNTQLLAVDVSAGGRFELGDTSGLRPTTERDLAYLLVAAETGQNGGMLVFDLSDPTRPVQRGRSVLGQGTGLGRVWSGTLLRSFNPPELVFRHAVSGEGGLLFQEVSNSAEPENGARLTGLAGARDAAVEAFAFDRMLDETGRQLKDISHEEARWLTPQEIHRVLAVPGEVLGTLQGGGQLRQDVTAAFGDRTAEGGRLDLSFKLRGLDQGQVSTMQERLEGGFRIGAREDLARLVRHAWPPDFDSNRDAALSRGELESLVFWVLDANGDGTLDILEWPRHPGDEPAALDKNRDGRLSRQEMDLGPEVTKFFDPDEDGAAEFAEWPFVVDPEPLPCLLYTSLEALKKLLRSQGFDRKHPDLFARLANGLAPHDIPDENLQQLLDRARADPLSDPAGASSAPGFIERWDLDGDAAVDAREHPGFARLAPRCDSNGDGEISKADRP
ncbi:MAG: hypothetical protein ACT4PU_07695 [Planctomycetota bacterium]